MSSEQGVSSSNNNGGSGSGAGASSSGGSNAPFQAIRQNSDNGAHAFENPMQMFAIKQQPIVSSVTGTIYGGPPAKYLNSNNGYMRPMLPPQKYATFNGSAVQQRRQTSTGVDNATNDSVK